MLEKLIGLVGIVAILGIAYLLSSDRKGINLRIVGSAFALQAIVAAFVIYLPAGQVMIDGMSNAVLNVLAYSRDGIAFIFGGLAQQDGEILRANSDERFSIWSFAVNVLPIIIFFSALASFERSTSFDFSPPLALPIKYGVSEIIKQLKFMF